MCLTGKQKEMLAFNMLHYKWQKKHMRQKGPAGLIDPIGSLIVACASHLGAQLEHLRLVFHVMVVSCHSFNTVFDLRSSVKDFAIAVSFTCKHIINLVDNLVDQPLLY